MREKQKRLALVAAILITGLSSITISEAASPVTTAEVATATVTSTTGTAPIIPVAPTASKTSAKEVISHMQKTSIIPLAPEQDTRVFKKDTSIIVKNVRFTDRYGYEIAGHLYLPKNFKEGHTYGAIAVSGPFGAVKEQSSGLYAQELAKHGYVTIAFDPAMTGESGGEVRDMASPDIFTEDYSAAVDFLGSLDFVDRNRIGALGICGLSGPAITAAVNDTRIKAIATTAMYDMSESIRDHYKGDYYTKDQREAVKQYLANMRWQRVDTGKEARGLHEVPVTTDGQAVYADTLFPDVLPANADSVTKEFFNYYRGRAYHPRAINSATAWNVLAPYGFFNFALGEHIEEISPRPILFITGDKAHSRYFSEEAYAKAAGPKELIVVPNATHTDLYDQIDKIPFDRLIAFYDRNL